VAFTSNLRTKMEVSGWPHAPAALPAGKRSRYPFNMRLCWPRSQSGPLLRRDMSLYLEGFECGFIYVSPFGKIAREEAIDRACWSVLGE